MNIPPFQKFVENPFPGRLITFDPGETTGYSSWTNSELVEAGQLATHTVKEAVPFLEQWIDHQIDYRLGSDHKLVVMEEYRVYAWKTDDHAQSTMHTSRLIGAMESMCIRRGIPYVMQGAGMAKPYATDVKLKAWNFWQRGERHARDAIRHGVYYLCKGKKYVPGSITL